VTAYAAKSNQPRDRIVAMMDAETWLTAAEALELGFADEVTAAVKIAAKFDLNAKFGHVPTALQPTQRDIAAASWDKVVNDQYRSHR
jgi:enoyl-CoA hydratase/carnithine racemase